MSTINNGNQTLTYDFKEEILSVGFNKLNYKLHPQGIYNGGDFVRISDTIIEITPLYCVFEDDVNKLSVRIETTENATVTVDNTKQYIVARFTWVNSENNFMDFVAVDYLDIQATDLILGRFQYIGIVLQETFDYSKKSWVNSKYSYFCNNPCFRVVPTFPYSNFVEVLPSTNKFIHNSKVIEITVKQTSPSFVFPVSSYGRKDIVAVDSTTNSIVVIKGADSSGAPLPSFEHNQLPIAIITFPPSAISTVKGEYIHYIHPDFYKSSNITDIELFTRLKTVSANDNGLDADLLNDVHATYFTNKINEVYVSLGLTPPF